MVSCSFCHSRTHNVKHCVDPRISIIYEEINQLYLWLLPLINSKETFKILLNGHYTIPQLKAICIIKMVLTPSSKLHAINELYEHFYSLHLNTLYLNILSEEEPEVEIIEVKSKPATITPIFDLLEEDTDDIADECAICFDNIIRTNQVTLNCSHQFCGVCINDCLSKSNGELTCALCRTQITSISSKNIDIYSTLCKKISKTT
jgi:hypothetical protein